MMRKLFVVALVALFAFLALPSVSVADDGSTRPPVIGANMSGISLYAVAWGWPDKLYLNGAEIVKVTVDVNLTNIDVDGDLDPIGLVCLIPNLPLCPEDE